MEIGPGVSELWGSKIALSHLQGPWLIQQLVLPYKPWKSWLLLAALGHRLRSTSSIDFSLPQLNVPSLQSVLSRIPVPLHGTHCPNTSVLYLTRLPDIRVFRKLLKAHLFNLAFNIHWHSGFYTVWLFKCTYVQHVIGALQMHRMMTMMMMMTVCYYLIYCERDKRTLCTQCSNVSNLLNWIVLSDERGSSLSLSLSLSLCVCVCVCVCGSARCRRLDEWTHHRIARKKINRFRIIVKSFW